MPYYKSSAVTGTKKDPKLIAKQALGPFDCGEVVRASLHRILALLCCCSSLRLRLLPHPTLTCTSIPWMRPSFLISTVLAPHGPLG